MHMMSKNLYSLPSSVTIISFFLLISFCHVGYCQNQLPTIDLQKDLTIIGDIAIGTAPMLSKEKETAITEKIQQKIEELDSQSLDVIEFTKFLSNLNLNTPFDEHAEMELEEKVLRPLLTGNMIFPIPVVIIDSLVVVNSAKFEIPFGSILKSINGEPVDSLKKSLGWTADSFDQRHLENQFSLVYLINKGGSESYKVGYSAPDNLDKTHEKVVMGTDLTGLVNHMNEDSVYPIDRELYSQNISTRFYREQNACYLRINSFSWYEEESKGLKKLKSDRANFKKAFNNVFKEIQDKEADHLIIDLRYNYGGNLLIPGLLYSYLANDSFIEHVKLKISDFTLPHRNLLIKVDDKEVTDTKDIDTFITRYQSEFTQTDDGYEWSYINKASIKPARLAFKGKVYLLIGGRTISAASYFTALFKSASRGRLIGEQIGGSHHSITAGTDVTYQLPGSSIVVTVPLMLVHFSDELYKAVPEKKIVPDIELPTDTFYQYFLNQKDPELEETLKLIDHSPQSP